MLETGLGLLVEYRQQQVTGTETVFYKTLTPSLTNKPTLELIQVQMLTENMICNPECID